MPIVYAPPQPFDATAAYGAGSAQMGAQLLPSILSASESAARLRISAAEIQAQGNQQSQVGAIEHARESAAANQQALSQGQDANMGVAQLNAQIGQNQAELQTRQLMQQAEFTQADNLQLQKLSFAQSTVQRMVSAGQLTPEEGQAYVAQIATGKNPLESKKAAADARAKQAEAEDLVQKGHMVAGMWSADAATKAQTIQRRSAYAIGPDGKEVLDVNGQKIPGWIDSKGDFNPYDRGKAEKPEKAEKDLSFEDEMKLRDQWFKQHDAIVKRVSDWANDTIKEGDKVRPRYPDLGQSDGPNGFDANVEKEMRRAGLAPTPDEHVQKHRRRKGQEEEGLGGTRPAEPKPYNPAEPKSRTQEHQVATFDDAEGTIQTSNLSADQKTAGVMLLNEGKQMLARAGGDLNKMSPEERKRYIHLGEQFGRLAAAIKQAPPPAQPQQQAPPAPAPQPAERNPFGGVPVY